MDYLGDLQIEADRADHLLRNGVINEAEFNSKINTIATLLREEDILDWLSFYFPDRFSVPFCELHNYLAIDQLHARRSAVLAPRGHAKTSIVCFGVILYLALCSNRYSFFLNIQCTASKAEAINRAIKRELETNTRLIADYGVQETPGKWTNTQLELANGKFIMAASSGSDMRGLTYNGIRPDYVVCDDIYPEESYGNPTRIAEIGEWFEFVLIPAMKKIGHSCLRVNGTAFDKNDIMHACQSNPDWNFKRFAIWDENKTPLWPEVFDRKTIENMMTGISVNNVELSSRVFAREYLNTIYDDASSIIRRDDIVVIDSLPADDRITSTICTVDPAAGLSHENDYTAICVMHKTENKNSIVVELIERRMHFGELKQVLMDLNNRYKLSKIIIEAIAGFKTIPIELKRSTDLPVQELTRVKDKLTRLQDVEHLFENKKVKFLSTIDRKTLQECIDQITTNRPSHDDLRDSVVMALEYRPRTMIATSF